MSQACLKVIFAGSKSYCQITSPVPILVLQNNNLGPHLMLQGQEMIVVHHTDNPQLVPLLIITTLNDAHI